MRLIPYKQFLTFPKEQRTEYLEEVLKEYSAKQVRDDWGMKPQTWYNLMSKNGLTGKNNPNPTTQKRQMENIIEAEFSVDEPEPKSPPAETQLSLAPQMTGAASAEALMNFPEITGNTAQLRNLVESMLMILEATNGKDGSFKLKIAVYQA